jgi:hypothetical protein
LMEIAEPDAAAAESKMGCRGGGRVPDEDAQSRVLPHPDALRPEGGEGWLVR